MSLKIKQVDVKLITPIRHRVLREGKPISTCYFDGDNLPETYHFAAFSKHQTIGCLSLMPKSHDKISGSNLYQLRGMAVLENYRGKNIGRDLLKQAEQHLISKNITNIWCNVRVKAIPFYSKNFYIKLGNTFNIEGVGLHVLMYKILNNA